MGRRHENLGTTSDEVKGVAAPVPAFFTFRSLRYVDPWWRYEPVRRSCPKALLTPQRRIGATDSYLIREEFREVILLDSRHVTTVRRVVFDKMNRQQSKQLLAIDETGSVVAYNSIPKRLMPLDGLAQLPRLSDKSVVVTEGYPAAESLRRRGIAAVGIISGALDIPSERTLSPLLKAQRILLWPDNDRAGVFLMSNVAAELERLGARDGQMKIVIWRGGPRKGDAYDFAGKADAIVRMLDRAVPWALGHSAPLDHIPRLPPPAAILDTLTGLPFDRVSHRGARDGEFGLFFQPGSDVRGL